MKIAREILVNDEVWTIVRKEKTGRYWGYAQFPERKITLNKGMRGKRLLKTVCHEVLHAFEFEYDIEIPHKLIYMLEEPIAAFLVDNGYVTLTPRKRKPKR